MVDIINLAGVSGICEVFLAGWPVPTGNWVSWAGPMMAGARQNM